MTRVAIPARERLIFALDVPTVDEARRLADRLGDSVSFYKVGLELFLSGGAFELIDWLVGRRARRSSPTSSSSTSPRPWPRRCASCATRPVTFTTVHGNDGILEAACREKGDLKILAVTVLTSLDRGDLDDLGFQVDVADLVLSRARRALDAGLRRRRSPRASRRGRCARSSGAAADRHPRHPSGREPSGGRPEAGGHGREAFRDGADYIVVGRPIRNAPDPRAAAAAIQATIADQFPRG